MTRAVVSREACGVCGACSRCRMCGAVRQREQAPRTPYASRGLVPVMPAWGQTRPTYRRLYVWTIEMPAAEFCGTMAADAAMRILVVEDEVDLLSGLAKALREEGYAVDTAEDGEDGLYKAESWEYDAVVLDVMLPRLDGWGVLQKLRKTKKTAVLRLTRPDESRHRAH